MLHAYDGLGVLEAGVDWAGVDGRYNPWVRDPMEDASRVTSILQAPAERVEIEVGHEKLKRSLVTHFAYRSQHKTVQ